MREWWRRSKPAEADPEGGRDDADDEAWLLALPTAEFGVEARRRALDAYARRDWHLIHDWTKSWISHGGGAWTVDAWLLYVISALLQGWPKSAVHSVDMALSTWIEAPEDRAVLHWVRASIIHRRLNDPKTAIDDYQAASERVPDWLRERVESDLAACSVDAETRRKRKPSVAPAPALELTEELADRSFVAPRTTAHEPGARPDVWAELLETFEERLGLSSGISRRRRAPVLAGTGAAGFAETRVDSRRPLSCIAQLSMVLPGLGTDAGLD